MASGMESIETQKTESSMKEETEVEELQKRETHTVTVSEEQQKRELQSHDVRKKTTKFPGKTKRLRPMSIKRC